LAKKKSKKKRKTQTMTAKKRTMRCALLLMQLHFTYSPPPSGRFPGRGFGGWWVANAVWQFSGGKK